MGRSYWFECTKCGYRARVSGRGERGLGFAVQTILCRDCKELFDAVTRLKVAVEPITLGHSGDLRQMRALKTQLGLSAPPTFQAVLNRLPPAGAKRYRWVSFKPECPISALHRVRNWNDPDQCPRCGVFLEKSALPYRLWD